VTQSLLCKYLKVKNPKVMLDSKRVLAPANSNIATSKVVHGLVLAFCGFYSEYSLGSFIVQLGSHCLSLNKDMHLFRDVIYCVKPFLKCASHTYKLLLGF
jgi:hypothetical protein